MILGLDAEMLWNWKWIFLILNCRTQSPYSLTMHTHTQTRTCLVSNWHSIQNQLIGVKFLHSTSLESFLLRKNKCNFHGIERVFLILYHFQGSPAQNPAQTHKASKVDREWQSKSVPQIPSWAEPSPVVEDKTCEPKHMSSWMQPVSFSIAL